MNPVAKTILITDSLFIFPEHENMLRNAGYEIERLDKPNATEEELIKAIKGKTGYILHHKREKTPAFLHFFLFEPHKSQRCYPGRV